MTAAATASTATTTTPPAAAPSSARAAGIDKAAFQQRFEGLIVAIQDEWPEVEAEALAQTGGDLDATVKLISDAAGTTRTRVMRHLAELMALQEEPVCTAQRVKERVTEKVAEKVGEQKERFEARFRDEIAGLKQMVERLESRSKDFADFAQNELPKEARDNFEQNLVTSLLVALGLGFLLGFIARGSGRQ